jgi:uncharacterized protein (DUF433 family)
MSSSVATQWVYLAPNPKSSYKQLFVKGTRIPARALYGWFACDEPLTAEAIAADYGLPLEAVREAIVYCQSNPPELLQDYARAEALAEAVGSDDPNHKHAGQPKLLSPQERHRLTGS